MTEVKDESDEYQARFKIVSSIYPNNQFINVSENEFEGRNVEFRDAVFMSASDEHSGAYISVEDAEALVVTLQFIIKIIKDRQEKP